MVDQKSALDTAPPQAEKPAAPSATVATALPVGPDDDPWTEDEVASVIEELNSHALRLVSELAETESEVDSWMKDRGGAGQDQVDVGSSMSERYNEMYVANGLREMLQQTEDALVRISAGTYGLCAECGQPIGKLRMMAFPRAALCIACKQREQRR